MGFLASADLPDRADNCLISAGAGREVLESCGPYGLSVLQSLGLTLWLGLLSHRCDWLTYLLGKASLPIPSQ